MGVWSKRKRAQMQDAQLVMQSAGWTAGVFGTEMDVSQEFAPEQLLPPTRWKKIVAGEKNRILDSRKAALNACDEKRSKGSAPTKNDARVIPGAYLLAKFEVKDTDVYEVMASVLSEWTLNEEQERAFRIVANHSVSVTPDPLRMYIARMGGTGKTRVISALRSWFEARGEKYRFVVLAPTGAAASQLTGSTYHSFLGVNTGDRRKSRKRGGRALDLARGRMRGVEYIFIDEVSMISCQDLYLIDARLKDITRVEDEPFGGVNVILAGDFAQLPPAKGNALYSSEVSQIQLPRASPESQENTLGLLVWHHFVTVMVLKQNMRQTNISAEDRALRAALIRMRYKECTNEDIQFLCTRIPSFNDTIDINDPRLRYASIITSWNTHKDSINAMNSARFAQEHGRTLHHFYSVDKQSQP
ncbi:hypothetical protein D9611_013116 [Ephemerocybe angulata]|uniref:ATP-dependent DNA helicase n=1 Tax=Ephemerocybe angulata TaxID=980116 RepID=A0A8H5BX74_9AGAR|nr:hypothetical protein D9611_013116 [Tulosesus angulatus]